MDNSRARLIEFPPARHDAQLVQSEFTTEEKQRTLDISEFTMHNKERQLQGEFFKKISSVILQFNEVLLFGPTTAKRQLFNLLSDDHRFKAIKIDVQDTDKITEQDQLALVSEYFSRSL